MYFDINKFKTYEASKLTSGTHNSILDMVKTRIKLETLCPGITFKDENYNRKLKLDCSAFYAQSGYEFLKVVSNKDNKIIIDVDYPKFDKTLETDFDGFTSLDQAFSILAVGNVHEVLKSEFYIRELLHRNKNDKKLLIKSCPDFIEGQKAYLMAKKFGLLEGQIDMLLKNAHKYMTKGYYM